MEWKNLHFVWKQFLFNKSLPNFIYSNTLKNLFKEKYLYDENCDSFDGITSKYLPVHQDFIKFWENTISNTNNANTNSNKHYNIFYDEIEIDELCTLFKILVKQSPEQLLTNGNITEDNILKILKHFFPSIEIVDNKYVLNVSCNLWDKNNDIYNSFNYIKEQFKNNIHTSLFSFDDAYNYYYKFCNLNSIKIIVSKKYFEKYLSHKIPNYIVYDKFIQLEWIQ